MTTMGWKRLKVRQLNQVILSGPGVQVNQVLQSLPNSFRHTALATFGVAQGDHRIALVQHAQSSAKDETETLNELLLAIARAAGLNDIRTEPNYTVVAAPKGNPYAWEGNPYAWEGNPYAWEGNPYAWEGNPSDQPDSLAAVAQIGTNPVDAAALFAGQDAFARIGVAEAGQRSPSLASVQGDGVLVGLFDSCPTADQLNSLPGGAPTWLHTHTVEGTSIPGGPYVDHGLFNASLVNFVAPNTEIHLYQVLNGEMYGETTWLIKALADFLNMAENRPTITSLSLGSMYDGSMTMPAVEAILSELVRRGGAVCAAAGNRARPALKAAAVPQAQMPAALPFVIAVAASNQQGVRASYSQAGDIAAPGGETTGAGPNGVDDFIGLGTASPTGYIQMDCGTSFATPLVAGAAALVLADLAQQGAASEGRWRQVLGRLADSAVPPVGAEGTLNTSGLGAGIIQLTGPMN